MCFSSFLSNVGATALKPSTCISAGMLPAMLSPSAKMIPHELTPGSTLALATASFASKRGTAAVTGASSGDDVAVPTGSILTLGSSAHSLLIGDSPGPGSGVISFAAVGGGATPAG